MARVNRPLTGKTRLWDVSRVHLLLRCNAGKTTQLQITLDGWTIQYQVSSNRGSTETRINPPGVWPCHTPGFFFPQYHSVSPSCPIAPSSS